MTDWQLHNTDSLDYLKTLDDCSIDSLCTDPPAWVNFMGKKWDSPAELEHFKLVAAECLRVLKPGSHGLVWALPRTSHHTAMALEQAGFEIRDVVVHLFGTGFPKSHDVSKAIDKQLGAERQQTGTHTAQLPGGNVLAQDAWSQRARDERMPRFDEAASEPATHWNGYGTALKPASEHWILVRKPLAGTVATNVLAHGTGALNIDGCRIAGDNPSVARRQGKAPGESIGASGWTTPPRPASYNEAKAGEQLGRWPANVTLDELAAEMLDEQSAPNMHSAGKARDGSSAIVADSYEATSYELPPNRNMRRLGDSGGASRFFYVAKGSRREKDAGLPDGSRNQHPTVKSIALMRWLVRLITPPGGMVLDPYAGSGTTGIAALLEGFSFTGIERDAGYCDIANARLQHWNANT